MPALIAIALCLLPLMGHGHVLPVARKSSVRFNKHNLGFDLLNEVECKNISFTYPTGVEVQCHNAALGIFIKEFEKVEKQCKDEDEHATQTKNELEIVHAQTRSETNCIPQMMENKNFNDLVTAVKDFTQKYNTILDNEEIKAKPTP